jgi:hypothetical protein
VKLKSVPGWIAALGPLHNHGTGIIVDLILVDQESREARGHGNV